MYINDIIDFEVESPLDCATHCNCV